MQKVGNYMENMNFEDAKIIFMIRSKMLDVKGNYKNKYEPNLKCELCQEETENQDHIVKCRSYEDIMENLHGKESMKEVMRQNKMQTIAKKIKESMKRREFINNIRKKMNKKQ